MSVFMGLSIMFWNCQGIRQKCKELELYLKENNFHIVALNETFLTKKTNFKIQGYDTIKNDRSTGVRGGVAFLVKHGLVVNKEYRNTDFNIITDNEALVIDTDLSNDQNLILATIYCPNGNPSLRLFETIKNLSDNVMFVGDFNSKLEAFGLRIESQASWEKFCNDISLETNHTESWRKNKNFLKPKGQRNYPALRLDAKTTKTNADKA